MKTTQVNSGAADAKRSRSKADEDLERLHKQRCDQIKITYERENGIKTIESKTDEDRFARQDFFRFLQMYANVCKIINAINWQFM